MGIWRKGNIGVPAFMVESPNHDYLIKLLAAKSLDEMVLLLSDKIPLECVGEDNPFTIIFKKEKDLLANYGCITDCTFSKGKPNYYKLTHNQINDTLYLYDLTLEDIEHIVTSYKYSGGKMLCIEK